MVFLEVFVNILECFGIILNFVFKGELEFIWVSGMVVRLGVCLGIYYDVSSE